jgi:histidine triad (HIT) family protein
MANKKENCIFCKIANGEISSNILYEDEDIIAFLDASPTTKGHALVVTKEHFDNVLYVPKDLIGKAFSVAQKIGQAEVSLFDAKGVNILTNAGEAAGQTVMHFHIHVIPRYDPNDGLQIGFTPKMIEKFDLPVLVNEIKKRI